MAYIFKLHKESGANIKEDWGKSTVYGENVLKEIEDPDSTTSKKEITSIPSPFARIDLVKNAFKIVAEGDLDGNTIYHKLVSETLDIAEILFNYDKFKDIIEIVPCKIENVIETLKNGANGHRQIGNTLEMFKKQDERTYNFNKMEYMFVLLYRGKNMKREMDIIGATSPSTLFFSSANDISHMSSEFHFQNDMAFDEEYKPLSDRDPKFIEYLNSAKKFFGHKKIIISVFLKFLHKYNIIIHNDTKNVRLTAQVPPPKPMGKEEVR